MFSQLKARSMNYYTFVSQPHFFSFLLQIDRSISNAAHQVPCSHCGGKLDWANFRRAGYGLPDDADPMCRLRFSLCCRTDGCRKRMTPESVRFLHGIAYTTIVLVLLSCIQHGLSPSRAEALTKKLKVSRQTITRWIAWWRKHVVPSAFWKERRGRFMPILDEAKLPDELLEFFARGDSVLRQALANLLQFLASWRKERRII